MVSSKRVVVRTLGAVTENPKYARYAKRVRSYTEKIQEEVIADCSHFIDMLHSYCIDRKGNSPETETFFILLAADMTRYMCEQSHDD